MQVPGRIQLNSRVSPATFARLCAKNPELRLERSRTGALEIMSPAGSGSAARNALLTMRLGIWNEGSGLGKVFDSSAGFTLPNSAVRSPDASWIALDRWMALPRSERDEGFASICPDLVAELRSPGDDLPRLQKKLREYIRQGARLGWLIDPLLGCVHVYRPNQQPEVLDHPASLSGEDVLPGFVLDLQGILTD